MAPNVATGQFVGATAYSTATNLFYVGVPVGNTTFTHGIVALRPQSDCTLALAWQQTAGATSVADNDNHGVTVANDVVYLTTGIGNKVYAYNAATGTPLWNSGTTITGPTMIAPTVDGHLYVSSWDGKLYAFGL
jgi:outer membrane protein assembly factor BamB